MEGARRMAKEGLRKEERMEGGEEGEKRVV